MGSNPGPPSEIPTYVAEGIERQDRETLAAIIDYCEDLIAQYDRELEPEELADEDEEVVDVQDTDESGGPTIVIKKVPCGKNCNGCPHGPYKYAVRREGDSLDWEYKGAVSE